MPALTLPATAGALHLASRTGAGVGRLDGVGAGLVVVLASSVVLLLETPSIDFAAWVLVALGALAAGAAALLARRVRRVPDGFIPAAVVRSRRYVLGALAALTLFGAYLAMLFAAPLLLLQDHDWTPTQLGLVLLPAAVMGALTARGRRTPDRQARPVPAHGGARARQRGGLLLAGARRRRAGGHHARRWGCRWSGSCPPRWRWSTACRSCSSPRCAASRPACSSSSS